MASFLLATYIRNTAVHAEFALVPKAAFAATETKLVGNNSTPKSALTPTKTNLRSAQLPRKRKIPAVEPW
jgi:hypothetical protein